MTIKMIPIFFLNLLSSHIGDTPSLIRVIDSNKKSIYISNYIIGK